jgi:hypothetical protein
MIRLLKTILAQLVAWWRPPRVPRLLHLHEVQDWYSTPRRTCLTLVPRDAILQISGGDPDVPTFLTLWGNISVTVAEPLDVVERMYLEARP